MAFKHYWCLYIALLLLSSSELVAVARKAAPTTFRQPPSEAVDRVDP
jgi:hypothetical protein